MSPIRTYLDAWHGAMHRGHPLTGPAAHSLRPAAEQRPGKPAAATTAGPARKAGWLDGPGGR